MKGSRITLVGSVLLGLASSVDATLIDNGNATITQTRNDGSTLMWLQNAKLAATETFGVSGIDSMGKMNWDTANNWIDAMNASNYLGYND